MYTILLAGGSLFFNSIFDGLLSWILLGYVIYAYSPELYPEKYRDSLITDKLQFLTALTALFFGMVVVGTLLPTAVPIEGQSSPLQQINLVWGRLFVGLAVSSLLIWLYFIWHQGDEILKPHNPATTLAHEFFYEDDSQRQTQQEKIPERFRAIWRVIEVGLFSIVLAFLSVLLGMGALFLALFSPIPELALLFGAAVNWVSPVPIGEKTEAVLSSVDSRLFRSFEAGPINLKGSILLVFTAVGGLISAMLFVASARIILHVIQLALRGVAADPIEPTQAMAPLVIALVTTTVAFLFAGAYSLFHWIRQFERVGPYARYWPDRHAEDVDVEDAVTRPPGLLVPAHLPLVGVVVFTAVLSEFSAIVALIVLAATSIVSLGIMIWGAMQVFLALHSQWRPNRELSFSR